MQFTKLKLAGFKSFVESTELLIEPGLTGVVGPNGCGKSNLVEALRWIMGETSSKQLRGAAMDDVIFGGTDLRPARNIAEVSLFLNNSKRDAPTLYNDRDEIDVIRRIVRGEGSAYRVNGGEVRARDVQTLFADAASGSRSTALVSQGQIGTLIRSKPTDRRKILEEAAGITGLHSRRHEAELRLKAAENNLERLDDFLQALEEQYKSLKKQVRQVTRYRNLSSHIRRAEAILIHHNWMAANRKLSEENETFKKIELKVNGLMEEIAKASVLEVNAANSIPKLREEEKQNAATLQRLVISLNEFEQEEKRIKFERQETEARLKQIKDDCSREIALKADAESALTLLDSEAKNIHLVQIDEANNISSAEKKLHSVKTEVTRLEQEVTLLTEAVAADEIREQEFKRQINESETRQKQISDRLDEVLKESKTAKEIIKKIGGKNFFDMEVKTARENFEKIRREAEQGEKNRINAYSKEIKEQKALQKCEMEYASLKAEQTTLNAILNSGDLNKWSPIFDILSVEPGYEEALVAALGEDLNAPVDENAPVFWRTLTPFNTPKPLPSGTRPLSSYVTGSTALDRRLSQIGVVENSAEGNKLAEQLLQGQRLVCFNGALWRWDGYFKQKQSKNDKPNTIEQRNRLKSLNKDIFSTEKTLVNLRNNVHMAQQNLQDAMETEKNARKNLRAEDIKFQNARDKAFAHSQETTEAQTKVATAKNLENSLRNDDAETKSIIKRAMSGLNSLTGISERREKANIKREELSDVRFKVSEEQKIYDNLSHAIDLRRQRLLDLEKERKAWVSRTRNAAQQIVTLENRLKLENSSLERLMMRPIQINKQRTNLLTEISGSERLQKAAAEALTSGEKKWTDAAKFLKGLESNLAAGREERVRCKAIVEQTNSSIAVITEGAKERIGCTPVEALKNVGVAEDKTLPSLQASEIRLERLKNERENMGPVNLRADVESEELNERIQTIFAEREDLVSAIARLRQGISNLNREGRTRLMKAFKDVDRHFRELFSTLFGGGKAHLALTEAEDPLEAGLEVMASPPGKKLQTLSLLSGGEQALTAIAILFAVFLTNPAPVCVLDEVDAPLDDANVERFCQLINEIAKDTSTKFLIVTHHRLTMARMDRLFGVTMSERGVSQLVSVDLKAAEQLREIA